MDTIILVALFCLGAVLASFIGVIAERIYTGQSFARGRSRCNSCARELTARDLVPIVSYLVSGGRCFSCGSKVPAAYLILEAALAVVFAYAYYLFGLTLLLPLFLSIVAVLTFIVVYDLRHTVVPTVASNLLLALCVVFALLSSPTLSAFGMTLLIAGAIGTAFLLLHVLSMGRAMGLGDAPVALALSLMAGPYAFGGLLLSFWIGALCGILILVLRKGGPRMGIEVPFVPFLALGYLAALFFSWNPLVLL